MKSMRVMKGGAEVSEQTRSARRRAATAGVGQYRVLAVPASKARELTGYAGSGRGTPAAPTAGHIATEVGRGDSLLLVTAPKEKAADLRRLIGRMVEAANASGLEAVERAFDKAVPDAAATGPVDETWRGTEAARWAEIREAWLQSHPSLTAAEVARLVGSTTRNPSALLNGWVEAKRVFGLNHGAKRLYPAFQIGQDGQPKEAFRSLLTTLGGQLDGWQLATWLTRPNAEFEGWKAPLEMIERAPEAVIVAARHEVAEASY